jgi:hypothetical protein
MGKRTTGYDNPALVTAKPPFGWTQLPNMKVAVPEVPCRRQGRGLNVDEIRKLPGVVDAFFVVEGTGLPTEVMPVSPLLPTTRGPRSRRRRS